MIIRDPTHRRAVVPVALWRDRHCPRWQALVRSKRSKRSKRNESDTSFRNRTDHGNTFERAKIKRVSFMLVSGRPT